MQTEQAKSGHNKAGTNLSEEAILKVSKEITVKFIEMGRITPATFAEHFKNIHHTLRETISEK